MTTGTENVSIAAKAQLFCFAQNDPRAIVVKYLRSQENITGRKTQLLKEIFTRYPDIILPVACAWRLTPAG